eukprot:Partr_v1_DN24811_c0_g1_i1_m29777 putative ddb1 and cul4 associated factor 7
MESQELLKYKAPWPVFALAWSQRSDQPWLMAIGSFIEDYKNKLQIIGLNAQGKLAVLAEDDHLYPMTKCAWMPSKADNTGPNLLATSGDYLRIWELSSDEDSKLTRQATLMKKQTQEYCAPITSFDWNEVNPGIIGSCSIDTTCSIWDIHTQTLKTQLIAHDKEVYDMGFTCNSADVFGSVGADGSLRMFDLRNLEHSTIVYESPEGTPLLRLAWNKLDPNYVATFHMDSPRVIILDIRLPSVPVAELQGHGAAINACAWAPHSSGHMITVGDDAQCLVWDLGSGKKYGQDPILSYSSRQEINNLSWSKCQNSWVAIASGDTVEALCL